MREEAARRFPLQWPDQWPRTKWGDRKRATFQSSETWKGQDGLTRSRKIVVTPVVASERLEKQIILLGGHSAVLSTNQELRLDGRPRVHGEPPDPGAAVYFTLRKMPICMACDKWDRVADNIAALAAHIDALRRIDRYGVGSLDQAFRGYAGLPAKGQTWRSTLGFSPNEPVSTDAIEARFRERSRSAHPDVPGGSHDAMASLTSARAEARKEVGL